ncbi:exported hypothetical protein [uncultured Paludibacter sp.]|nr:exported hypothetical protein [uncultured Paludibacter sp.]
MNNPNFTLFFICFLLLGSKIKAQENVRIATFENLTLEPESRWWGDNTSSNYQSTFQSGAYIFTNTLVEDYMTWGGFAYSNFTSTAFESSEFLEHQFHSAVGNGVDSSKIYAVVYPFGAKTQVSTSDKPDGDTISGFYITNNAWVKYCSENGTGMSSTDDSTGKEPFKHGDWYKITATGSNGKTADFYLADYRSENPEDFYTLDTWQWFDLRPLGKVKYVRFKADGTRKNSSGSTIPFYFCMDNFGGERKIENSTTQTINITESSIIDLEKIFPAQTGSETATYQITDMPNADIITAIINNSTLTLNGFKDGNTFIVISKTVKGKTVFSKIPLVVNSTTNVKINQIPEIKITPNPATSYISLNSDGILNIYSPSGMKIYENANYINGTQINVSNWDKGVYFIKTKRQTVKFIKQ